MKVIARAPGLPGAAQGASSTAEFQFQASALDGNAATGAFVKISAEQLKKRPIRVRAGGSVVGGTTTDFTANLDYGSSTTIGSNTTITTTGAIAVNSESANWKLEVDVYLDLVSGKLQGVVTPQSWVNGGAVSTAVITEIGSLTNTSELSFNATGTFSASDADNAAKLEYLEILA